MPFTNVNFGNFCGNCFQGAPLSVNVLCKIMFMYLGWKNESVWNTLSPMSVNDISQLQEVHVPLLHQHGWHGVARMWQPYVGSRAQLINDRMAKSSDVPVLERGTQAYRLCVWPLDHLFNTAFLLHNDNYGRSIYFRAWYEYDRNRVTFPRQTW